MKVSGAQPKGRGRITLIVTVGAVILLVLGVIALTQTQRSRPSARPAFPLTVVDDLGVTVTVIGEPQRIVSLAPQFTETLFALGAGRRIVGVTAGETFPLEATALPTVVAADGITPDPIRIGEIAPDLVVSSGGDAEWKRALRNTGTSLVTLEAVSLDDAIQDVLTLGALVGKRTEAEKLVATMRREMAQITGEVADRESPRIFFETFYPPLIGASSDSFVGDLVNSAGGKLVDSPSSTDPYPLWTLSELVAADPEIYLAPSTSLSSSGDLAERPGFDQLRAVKESRVFVISDELVFRPGPRIVEGLRELVRLIGEPPT